MLSDFFKNPSNKTKKKLGGKKSGTSFVYLYEMIVLRVIDFDFSDLFSEVHVEKSYFKNRFVSEKKQKKIQMFSIFLL